MTHLYAEEKAMPNSAKQKKNIPLVKSTEGTSLQVLGDCREWMEQTKKKGSHGVGKDGGKSSEVKKTTTVTGRRSGQAKTAVPSQTSSVPSSEKDASDIEDSLGQDVGDDQLVGLE